MMIKAFKVSKVFALLLLLLVVLLLLLHIVLLSFGPSCDGQFVIEEAATELKENVVMRTFVADNNTKTTSFVVSNGMPAAEVLQVNVQSQQQQQQRQRVLSRRKRFVAFPEGSSFSTAVCMTTGVLGNPEVSYISMGLNWGIAYDLPNSTWVLQHAHGFPKTKETAGVESVNTPDATPAAMTDPNKGVKQFPIFTPGYKRRQRRELYGKLETLMDHAEKRINFDKLSMMTMTSKARTAKQKDAQQEWRQQQQQYQQQGVQQQQHRLQHYQQHHNHQRLTMSAACGVAKQMGQQQNHVVVVASNCNAIKVMADNFPNETQNEIEIENQSIEPYDLLSKHSTVQRQATAISSSSSSSGTAAVVAASKSTAAETALAAATTSSISPESLLLPPIVPTPAASLAPHPLLSSALPSTAFSIASSSLLSPLSTSTYFFTAFLPPSTATSTTSSLSTTTTSTLSSSSALPTTSTALTPLLAASSLLTAATTKTTTTPIPTTTATATAKTTPALPLNFKLNPRSLSRPKRFIAFPEGSSFSVAVCFTVGIIGNPRFNYMSFGLNWGVAYDLPNTTWVLNNLHGFSRHPVPVLRRRTRRTLYKEVARAVDNMGYNGRDCILRALCESRQYFERTKMGMIGEMLRVVFSLPKQRIFTRELHESSDIGLYDRAYRKARATDCTQQYDCGFSLLELALGRYSMPPAGYYKNY